MKKYIIVFLCFIFIIALALISKNYNDKPLSSDMKTTVVKANIEHIVLASGTMDLADQVNIGAQVNGQIQALHVKSGDRVKKGDLLVEIDPILPLNELHKVEANVKSIEAQIYLKNMRIKHLTVILKRQEQLHVIEGVSQADVDNARMDLMTAQQELNVLKAQLQQAFVDVDSAKANLSYTRITSPIDGTILQVFARKGQTVVSAQSSPTLMVIGDINNMLVKAKISEADIDDVAKGQLIWFTTFANPERKFFGQLELIESLPESTIKNKNIDSAASSTGEAIYYNGVFYTKNPGNFLLPGMNVQVRIITHRIKGALIIPIGALQDKIDNKHYNVSVVHSDGTVRVQKVFTGIIVDNNIEVIDGLSEGDIVMVPNSNE